MIEVKPEISIIIPVYNAEKTLGKCVESLVLGKIKDIEIILVNDCSPDGSAEVCRQLCRTYPQIVYVENEKNRGVSYSRNRGLKAADGEYVFFVDSDDWVSGDYLTEMIELAQEHPKMLPVCGYTFIDYTQKLRTEYLLDQPKGETHCVLNLFELEKNVLLQLLWNKVFRRDVIVENELRFDEKLSMGEDFQFVLDYMEAAQIHSCAVLNRPLYYYIRANQNSLMSKWLDVPFDKRIQSHQRMVGLMEDKEAGEKEYALFLERLKNNILYQTFSTSAVCWKQKWQTIAVNAKSEDDRKRLFQVIKGMAKESVYGQLMWVKRFPKRLKAKIIREHVNPRIVLQRRKQLTADEFTLICQNCIGGVFYHEMGKAFLSPTINLFFREPDFMRFVGNLEYYLNLELRMQWEEEYPIGFLDDVRIDFMHYDNCREARDAWERRKKRIRKDRIVVIATDRNGFDDACFEQWRKLPYRKILYTANPKYAEEPGAVFYPECAEQGYVDNIIDRKAFYKDHVIFDVINSLDDNA